MDYYIYDKDRKEGVLTDAPNVATANSKALKSGITNFTLHEADAGGNPTTPDILSKIRADRAEAHRISEYGTPDSQYSLGNALMPHNATIPADAGQARKIASGAWDLATFLPRVAVAGYRAPVDQPMAETLHTIANPTEGLSGLPKTAAEIVANPINYIPFGRIAVGMSKTVPTAARLIGGAGEALANTRPVAYISNALKSSENLGPTLAKTWVGGTSKTLPPVVNLAANVAGAAPRAALEASAYTGANNLAGDVQGEPTAPFLPSAGLMAGAGAFTGGAGKSISQILPGMAKSQFESIIDISNKERKANKGMSAEDLLDFQSASGAPGVNLVPAGNAKTLQDAYETKLDELKTRQDEAITKMSDFYVNSSVVLRKARQLLDDPETARGLDESEYQQVLTNLKQKNSEYQAQSRREQTPPPIIIPPTYTTQAVITPEMTRAMRAAQLFPPPPARTPAVPFQRDDRTSMSMALAAAKKTKTGHEAHYEYVNDPNKTNVQNTTERIMSKALKETMLNEGAVHLPSNRAHTISYVEDPPPIALSDPSQAIISSLSTVGKPWIKKKIAAYREGKKAYEDANADFAKLLPWQEPINREVAKATNRGLSPSELMAASAGLLGGFASGNHGASVAGLSIAGLLHYSKTPGAASAAYELAKQLGPDKAIPMAIRMGLIDPAAYQALKGKQ